jgi:hypothetical protein
MLNLFKEEFAINDNNRQGDLLKKKIDVEKFRKEKEDLETRINDKKNNLKASITLQLKFGINLNNRAQDGFFLYSQNRLIIKYDKTTQSDQVKPEYSGIVGIVDIPYSLMAPNQNKQSFNDEIELKKIKQTMFIHLSNYYNVFRKEISRQKKYDDIELFWNDMGYASYDVEEPDVNYAEQRKKRVKPYLHCNSCLKFRLVPNRPSDNGKIWSHVPNENCHRPEQPT